MQRTTIGLFICLSLLTGKEGLWLPPQIASLPLHEAGFHITANDIYNPDGNSLTDAIVNLGGGTSEFVSGDGLLLTNHHVAYGAVQRASTQGTDYLTNGFLAASREAEIQAPGTSARILRRVENVTDRITRASGRIKSPVARERAIKAAIQALREEVEAEGEDVDARIATMYSGQEYWLYVYQRFDDVRVVYMPPLAIGNYGAEIDNWMWPRHSGDFAFMRVYSAPDGHGRAYDPENVPYHPKRYLKLSTHDLDPGDLTFILGYPGRTNRYRTSWSVDYNLRVSYPRTIAQFEYIIGLLDSLGAENPQAAMKVAGRVKGLANYLKKTRGMQTAMGKADFLNEKRQFEDQLTKFIQSKRKLRKKYGAVLSDIGNQFSAMEARDARDHVLGLFGWLGGTLASNATAIVYTVKEREKPDEEREPNFSEKDVDRRIERLKYGYYSYYEPAERALLTWVLNQALALPPDQRIAPLDDLIGRHESVSGAVDFLISGTKLSDVEQAKTWFKSTSKELQTVDDPLIQLALALYPLREEMDDWDEAWNADMKTLRRSYLEAVQAYRQGGMYPDANGTLRFTYGYVSGYSPRDAVNYFPQTTLTGVIEKDTGIEPFNMPPVLRTLEE
ncbi:MAG: S46 family peptidase, partial [Fidelibacterota bacterium]